MIFDHVRYIYDTHNKLFQMCFLQSVEHRAICRVQSFVRTFTTIVSSTAVTAPKRHHMQNGDFPPQLSPLRTGKSNAREYPSTEKGSDPF